MSRSRPGQRQVNWWLDEELVDRLNEYRYENRLESLTEAGRILLDEAVSAWEKKRQKKTEKPHPDK